MKRQDALDYHSRGRPGKIAVVPTKPLGNSRDLSLAYSPGVAEPCLEIKANPDDAYKYTAKGNLVAVVTNGTAVLGLGNIGALAGRCRRSKGRKRAYGFASAAAMRRTLSVFPVIDGEQITNARLAPARATASLRPCSMMASVVVAVCTPLSPVSIS